jgi:hypothetical protein
VFAHGYNCFLKQNLFFHHFFFALHKTKEGFQKTKEELRKGKEGFLTECFRLNKKKGLLSR